MLRNKKIWRNNITWYLEPFLQFNWQDEREKLASSFCNKRGYFVIYRCLCRSLYIKVNDWYIYKFWYLFSSINGVSEKGCASPCVGLFSKSSTECTTSGKFSTLWFYLVTKNFLLGQLYAIYGSLFVTFALFLECISFITESAGFTYPLFLKLFRRYGILHFFAVIFVMISAGLWYGFSEHLMHNLDQYPKERGSKVLFFSVSIDIHGV